MEVPLIHDKVSQDEARARAVDIVKSHAAARSRAGDARLSAPAQRRPAQRVVYRDGVAFQSEAVHPRRADAALDVTVEAGIVALVKDLAARTGASSLFISHNLGLISRLATK